MKKLLFGTMLCLLVFASCKSVINNEEVASSSLDGVSDTDIVTPYTDMSLLENTRSATMSDPDVVNWKVARFFAVVKKIEFEDYYESWKGAKVSEKPIVIYNPSRNTPMYYEFRVIKAGIELGSITCHATKDSSGPVAYVSEMTSKVTAKVAKALIRDELKLVAVNYPGKFVVGQTNIIGIKGLDNVESVEFRDGITAEKLDKDNVFIPLKTKVMLETADDKALETVGVTTEEKLKMLEILKEEEEEAKDLWEGIDEQESHIVLMTDDEIESMIFSENTSQGGGISTKSVYNKKKLWSTEKTLYDWDDKARWIPEYGSYCSTNVLSLIVMGLGEKSGFFDYALKGKNTSAEKEAALRAVIPSKWDTDKVRMRKINDIYARFDNELGINHNAIPIRNARIIESLRTALSNRTNYTMELHGTGWDRVDNHIRNYELPVVSLRIGGWFRYKSLALHYRTITGTWKGYYEYKHKYFKRRKPKYGYEYWYWMADNGTDGTRFWECATGSYQTQTGLVKRKNNH